MDYLEDIDYFKYLIEAWPLQTLLLQAKNHNQTEWKPRSQDYTSHVKKEVQSCSIVNYFIDVCSDSDDHLKMLDLLSLVNSIKPTAFTLMRWDSLLLQNQ